MSPLEVLLFSFLKRRACTCVDGNDPGADIGNAGGQIIRGLFLGIILKPFSLCYFP